MYERDIVLFKAVIDLGRSSPALSIDTSNDLLVVMHSRILAQKYCGVPAPKYEQYRHPKLVHSPISVQVMHLL
jgi:hypothetical protein